jgi:hypothetical protein
MNEMAKLKKVQKTTFQKNRNKKQLKQPESAKI